MSAITSAPGAGRYRGGAGRVLIAVSSVYTGAGSYAFDWNPTHIHNPSWPPHAKFHNAQTMSMGVALALTTVWQLWKRTDDPRAALDSAAAAAAAASLYWLTQFSAVLYPGTASADPPAPDSWFQLRAGLPNLAVVALGYVLERRRLARS